MSKMFMLLVVIVMGMYLVRARNGKESENPIQSKINCGIRSVGDIETQAVNSSVSNSVHFVYFLGP